MLIKKAQIHVIFLILSKLTFYNSYSFKAYNREHFQNTIDVALEIIDAFQPDMSVSNGEQVAVLQEFGKVSIKVQCSDCVSEYIRHTLYSYI